MRKGSLTFALCYLDRPVGRGGHERFAVLIVDYSCSGGKSQKDVSSYLNYNENSFVSEVNNWGTAQCT